ncbi:MAG TPA: OmpH family outer membrane protein [Rhizomicrobium sp.]|jgi:Skp family chaperone for outer membrane proteins|nr:OmpH family outer membrane protein [Rhizomicrobium sp.]
MIKSKLALRAALAAAGIAAVASAAHAQAPAAVPKKAHAAAPAGAPVPAPRIIVVDRQAILRLSKVGQDIVRQVNSLTQSAEGEFRAQRDALQKEEQTLAQQDAILAPDVRAQKKKAFEDKVAAFQKKVQARQGMIQEGVMNARRQVESALGPILQGVMAERGANLLLDRQDVVLAMVDIDVTKLTIQRLDQKLPSVKVQLATPSLADQLQMMQQQQQQMH